MKIDNIADCLRKHLETHKTQDLLSQVGQSYNPGKRPKILETDCGNST
jgi:hypothetical protein